MSDSRRNGRGFSAGSAFVLAVLLTLTAVAVQATVPTFSSVSSQSAAADASDAQVIEVANKTTTQTPQSSQPSASKAEVKPGKDVITILVSGQPQADLYFPVCPQNPPDPTANMKAFVQEAQKFPVYNKMTANKFGSPDGRCKADPQNANRQVPSNPSQWQQWTLYCQSKGVPTGAATAGATVPPQDITDSLLSKGQKLMNDTSIIQCVVIPPGAQVSGQLPSKTPEQIKALLDKITQNPSQAATLTQGLNAADRDALNAAFGQQSDELKKDTADRTAENKDIKDQISQLKEIAASGGDCSDNVFASSGANSADLCKEQIANLTTRANDNQKQIDANNKQLKDLAAAQVALNPKDNPNQGPCPDGSAMGANGCPSSSPTPSPTPSPYSGGGNTGGGFNNPGLGANNTPQSPFGGACNTRYICSGNTLYYQSANSSGMYGGYNPYGGSGQCMTQPVQQCQYGCQQMAAQTGAQQTLGGVMAGLQIFSSLSRMFGGGGGATNNLANTNLPSSCAMTPQQGTGGQSPYGTGTNGQPCYQPPQQPDPAQCTSGQWRATSAQQNGCTTGWQCVPNGNGSSDNKPTAQLSCQPQIADTGMPISFSFACGNASGSTGTGFSTGGALSGNATSTAPEPPSGQNTATYTLTCINLGITTSAQCQVQLSKSGIVLVTNPKTVQGGETSLIGWITSGMQSCVISSPDQQDFTARNAGNTSPNGAATTSPITGTTRFQLSCQSAAGNTKIATTTVSLN